MSTPPADLELRLLTMPASVDAADAADFLEMVRVRNLVYAEINGNEDESIAPDELLPAFRPDQYELRFVWLAVLDGAVVGRIGVDIPLEEGSRVVFWRIELLRSSWGRGIGTAAYELVERVAREHDRTVLQSWATHPDAPGPRIAPPTGFGTIPEDHAARFYLRNGYSLEQVERMSALDLAEAQERLTALLAEARAASTDYRVVQWFAPTPPEYIEGYAWMKSRMITDAPAAAMEFDEEVWDAARLARHDSMYTDVGRTLQVTAAQHVETGALVAFNELVIGKDRTTATAQEDTLVLKEHRGHRLGLLVKCAGLAAWHEVAPESPRVITYNAEENRPMLDINETIGFVPVAYNGAWKKTLS
ncbi:histone acetyltransferase [Microbacterium sp. Root61]|uniref:GNAT family N-acetyltransferase n=1 Tax=Microbacterium sp. Root61 TaxID=1736570 RepID=UPI0006FEC76E|nr:GNAT family N-acetyltransferase [Microbacterium sp. Root61]KRA23579.1 histone acetyltransferase [Microbacterium sp. Root61]